MVHGVAILLILTIFVQSNMGVSSVFDKFSSPEKKDKNKMLMYLRGMLKLDSSTTTIKINVNKRAGLWITTTPKSEAIWDGKSLPDRSDKSKMLAYLRGLKAPDNIFSLYEVPKHQGLIHSKHSTEDNQNTAVFNSVTQNIQNNPSMDPSIVINTDKLSNPGPQSLWENPTATQITFLQPSEKERDSDTCFWRGENAQLMDQAAEQQSPVSMKKTQPFNMDIENIGEHIKGFWACMQKKFWISYDQIQKKICGMF